MSREHEVEVTVISGLSGAGRSEAARALEDLGWFVIDNLPPALIDKMLALALGPGGEAHRLALVIDARGGTFFEEAAKAIEKLRQDISNFRMVFLEASDEALVRRFDATRRRHPLATEDRVIVGIQRERALMNQFRDEADVIIDTSDLSAQELRLKMAAFFSAGAVGERLYTTVISFGYKFGLPVDADVVLDVRFLPNPHWVESLRPFTGLDEPVRDYVLEQPATSEFLDRAKALFEVLLPGYQREGRHYLTVAIGCTGGRHRSVALAEAFGRFMHDQGVGVKVIHRDMKRTTTAS